MLNTLKKLFSLDESEFEEFEDDSQEYEELKKEILPKNTDTTLKMEQIKQPSRPIHTDSNLIFKEVDLDEVNITNTRTSMFIDNDIFEDEEETKILEKLEPLVSEEFKVVPEITVNKVHAVPQATPSNKTIIRESAHENLESIKKAKAKSHEYKQTKEEYVLRDLISPMRGIIKKETNTLKKPDKVERSKIIRLRDSVKVAQLETPVTNVSEVVELDYSEQPKALAETSRFTLVEDNTGELRIFLDEGEEE